MYSCSIFGKTPKVKQVIGTDSKDGWWDYSEFIFMYSCSIFGTTLKVKRVIGTDSKGTVNFSVMLAALGIWATMI